LGQKSDAWASRHCVRRSARLARDGANDVGTTFWRTTGIGNGMMVTPRRARSWKRRTRPRRTWTPPRQCSTPLVVLVDAHPRQHWLRTAVERRLREELATLQVEVNEEKTRRVDLTQGERFGFLGFDFRRIRSRRDRWMPLRTPRGNKRTALLRMLKEIFRSHRARPISEVIAKINPMLRGWCNTLPSAIRADASRTFATGSKRRFGTIWYGPVSVTVLAGRGGARRGCMGRSDSSRSIAWPADHRRSTLPTQTAP
jgi:group II intron maturase